MSIILSNIDVQDIYRGDSEKYSEVQHTDWCDEGKYGTKDIIFTDGEKNYRVTISRSGSYYTDYYYDFEDTQDFKCLEVVRATKTIEYWKEV